MQLKNIGYCLSLRVQKMQNSIRDRLTKHIVHSYVIANLMHIGFLQFHHVYNLAMMESVTQSHEYREAFQFLRLYERNGLGEVLTTLSSSLENQGMA